MAIRIAERREGERGIKSAFLSQCVVLRVALKAERERRRQGLGLVIGGCLLSRCRRGAPFVIGASGPLFLGGQILERPERPGGVACEKTQSVSSRTEYRRACLDCEGQSGRVFARGSRERASERASEEGT
eukprot:3540274-Rhodomonas_salina.1